MRYGDYVPGSDTGFCNWGDGVVVYATEHCSRFGVNPPDPELATRLKSLRTKVELCGLKTRSAVDVLVKNNERAALEKDLRNYVQGFLARNINVTDEDRKIMGVPIYDKKPTPVGNPVGLVTATFKYTNEGALELQLLHAKGSPFDPKANYGICIRSGVFPSNEPLPESVNQLLESRFTRRKKELFTFANEDRKKTACFCMRYENSKGMAGQWGQIVSAVIP